MVWYNTKKGILQRMGKNEKSIRSLDRAIKREEVIEKDGMYAYRLDLLSETVNKLDAEVKELKKSEFTGGDLEEAKAQREYWEKECKRYGKLMNLVIRTVYRKIKPLVGSKLNQSEDEFKEAIIEEIKNSDEYPS